MPDVLQNGQDFESFHKAQSAKYVGFRANHRGTRLDAMTRFVDSIMFTTHMQLDEIDKAHEIDYAHGLELDDIGDNVDIARNGLDDPTYRFLLKCHEISNRSQGTWSDIKNLAAVLLGCQPEDVEMINSSSLDKDNNHIGEFNTVEIVDVDITKVTHANLISMLADQLQSAMAGGYKIKQVGFAAAIDLNTYVGVGMQAHAGVDIKVPPYIEVKMPMSMTASTGVGMKFDYYVQI